MWVDTILFAARHHANHDDGAGAILGLIVIVVLFALFAIRAATARYDLVQRNGLPYCPRSDRQVSLRREFCRACGYRFVTYGSSPATSQELSTEALARERSQRAWRQHLAEEEARRREEEQRRTAQEAEKRSALTALNIDVGDGPPPLPKPKVSLLERYRALPDLAQAVVMGLGIAVPAVVLLFLVFGFPKPEAAPAPSADLVLPAGTPALPADATVYVTRRGTRYHKEACTQLLDMGTPLAFREATREFVPCRECWLDPQPVAPAPPPVAAMPPKEAKADPAAVEPIAALAAIPKAGGERDQPPIIPGGADDPPADPPAAAAPTRPPPPPAERAAPAPPPAHRVIVAGPAPAVAPSVRVPIFREPRRDYRRTAKVEYRRYEPAPRATETRYGATPTGIPTFTGPRGGIYHYSPSGRKVYESSRRRR